MDLAGYVALTRASGLAKEMQSVANNIANLGTTGYRREGVIFAEEVRALPIEGGSVAMTAARARFTDDMQGALEETGGSLDLAIEGGGYFTVMTPQGERLTRAGAFTRNGEGTIVTMDGHALLDEGGGEIAIPPEAKAIGVAADGTLSADGAPVAKIGLVTPVDPAKVSREAGTLFRAAATEPVEAPRVVQGFLEQSNVNPIAEMARMIEVQRAYEYGQKLMDQEDERIRLVVKTLGQLG
ncbi:flagellar basal-body rod protein FlgF [Amaricoccus macauensis]|uniref:Flagellar basal-body rod protein FlgF n=1 Tax=Amaricoccus macauensis TaxID=57001 RepID=A0A840SEB8_9RHOB|nr:flagellar hook-basal body complex protein [Amaricoccus macauensis]MBB5221229.1 flagellar basal-body rod protein FlgF [Amaricoccus macauensis]